MENRNMEDVENVEDEADVAMSRTDSSVKFRKNRGQQQSLRRLTNIVSMYIPFDSNDGGSLKRPLLETSDEVDEGEPDSKTRIPDSGYKLSKLLDIADLQSEDQAEDLPVSSISNIALSSELGYVFLTFKNSPIVLRLELKQDQGDTVNKRAKKFTITLKDSQLIPTDMKVFKKNLFISGTIQRGSDKANSVIVKCNLDGKLVLISNELPSPKFAGFDLDAEGNLLVASPMAESREVQVFKMSPDFKRKLYKISLGAGATKYKPEYVACMDSSNCCWVSTQRSDKTGTRSRLLSFPLQDPNNEGRPTKAWLKVSSWKFANVDAKRLLACDDKLLLIDSIQGNILGVTGSQSCQAITHTAAEGGPYFTSLCRLQRNPGQTGNSETDVLATTDDSVYLVRMW